MKAGIKETGGDELRLQMRNVAKKVPDNARKVMHRAADKIVEEAKLNAPVDDGELEASIHKEVGYQGSGRLKIDVVAGGEVNGVDVDRYALFIHELYGLMKPGPNTIAKQNANPGRLVGEKFLERAEDTVKEKLDRVFIDTVYADLKRLED